MTHSVLPVLAWRRDVAEIYAAVRGAHDPRDGHRLWQDCRDQLFGTSSASPLPAEDPRRKTGLRVAAYDPQWRVVVPLEPAEPLSRELDGGDDGPVRMRRAGTLRTPWGTLDAWLLSGYGGGLFVPVRDLGSGSLSYGGGRYLLDTIKGADLGATHGGLILDLNFLYAPSCAYDPRWTCPLAPPGNALDVVVSAGELIGSCR